MLRISTGLRSLNLDRSVSDLSTLGLSSIHLHARPTHLNKHAEAILNTALEEGYCTSICA